MDGEGLAIMILELLPNPRYWENINIFWCSKNYLHWSCKHDRDLSYLFLNEQKLFEGGGGN